MKASLGHNVGMVGPHSVIFLVLMSNESAMLAGHLPSLLFGLPSLATPSFSLRAKVQKHKQLTRLVLWHALGALDFSWDVYLKCRAFSHICILRFSMVPGPFEADPINTIWWVCQPSLRVHFQHARLGIVIFICHLGSPTAADGGIWPVIYSATLLPGADRQSPVPAYPCLGIGFDAGRGTVCIILKKSKHSMFTL